MKKIKISTLTPGQRLAFERHHHAEINPETGCLESTRCTVKGSPVIGHGGKSSIRISTLLKNKGACKNKKCILPMSTCQ